MSRETHRYQADEVLPELLGAITHAPVTWGTSGRGYACGCQVFESGAIDMCWRHHTWAVEGFELDEGGLPVHLPMWVNKDGSGPLNDSDPEKARMVCWCGEPGCLKYARKVDGDG